MEPNDTCSICGGTMKADANTEPQLRCDKCGHQEVSSVGLKETVKGSVSIGVQTLKEDRS